MLMCVYVCVCVHRRLYVDPAQPEAPFNYDGLLKIIKKLDKDLGP